MNWIGGTRGEERINKKWATSNNGIPADVPDIRKSNLSISIRLLDSINGIELEVRCWGLGSHFFIAFILVNVWLWAEANEMLQNVLFLVNSMQSEVERWSQLQRCNQNS